MHDLAVTRAALAMILAAVATLAACHGSSSPTPSPSPSPSPSPPPVSLPGRLEVPATVRSSSELTARLTITNRGSAAMAFTQGALELAVLALEVRDAANARVPTIPPPVPRADDATAVTLAPGASLSRDYAMGVFSPPLAPGRYVMTCRVVACAPVPFVVAP